MYNIKKMEDEVKSYCFIDNKNNTNSCVDSKIVKVYSNKDTEVYKLNSYSSPSSMYLNPGINTTNPTHIGKSNNQNNLLTPSLNSINNGVSDSLKELSNNFADVSSNQNIKNTTLQTFFDNNTQSYAHIGHLDNDNTTRTFPIIN